MTQTKTPDLFYTVGDMFTTFVPNTKAGEQAWKKIAEQTEGTGKVFNHQAQGTLQQLRKAGYNVSKQPKMSKKETEALFNEFDELFGE